MEKDSSNQKSSQASELEDIYEEMFQIFLTYVYRSDFDSRSDRLHEEVQDVFQDVFLNLYTRASKGELNAKNIKSYFFVALKHRWLETVSKNIKTERISEGDGTFSNHPELITEQTEIDPTRLAEYADGISIVIDPGNSHEKEIISVYTALSDLFRSLGGSGIKVDDGNGKLLVLDNVRQ